MASADSTNWLELYRKQRQQGASRVVSKPTAVLEAQEQTDTGWLQRYRAEKQRTPVDTMLGTQRSTLEGDETASMATRSQDPEDVGKPLSPVSVPGTAAVKGLANVMMYPSRVVGATAEGVAQTIEGGDFREGYKEARRNRRTLGDAVFDRIPENATGFATTYSPAGIVRVPESAARGVSKFALDVAGDPLTYAGIGAATKAGRAARMTRSAVENVTMSMAKRAELGELALVSFAGKRVPLGPVEKAVFKSADKLQQQFYKGGVFYENFGRYFVSRTGDKAMDFMERRAQTLREGLNQEYITRYGSVHKRTVGDARKAGMTTDEFKAAVRARLERTRGSELPVGISEVEVAGANPVALTDKQNDIVNRAVREMEDINREVFELEQKSGLHTNLLEGDREYWAHIITPEGRDWLAQNRGFPGGAREWNPKHKNQLERMFSKNKTIDEANEEMRRLGFEGDFFVTDPFVVGAMRAGRAARAISSRKFIDDTIEWFTKNSDAEVVQSNAMRVTVREPAKRRMTASQKQRLSRVRKRMDELNDELRLSHEKQLSGAKRSAMVQESQSLGTGLKTGKEEVGRLQQRLATLQDELRAAQQESGGGFFAEGQIAQTRAPAEIEDELAKIGVLLRNKQRDVEDISSRLDFVNKRMSGQVQTRPEQMIRQEFEELRAQRDAILREPGEVVQPKIDTAERFDRPLNIGEVYSGAVRKKIEDVLQQRLQGSGKSLFVERQDLMRAIDTASDVSDPRIQRGIDVLRSAAREAQETGNRVVDVVSSMHVEEDVRAALYVLGQQKYKAYVLPETAVETLNRVYDFGNPNDFFKPYRTATSWWKRNTLSGFTSYHLRNEVGNWSNNALGGIYDPGLYDRGAVLLSKIRNMNKTGRPIKGEDALIVDAAKRYGVLGTDQWLTEMPDEVYKAVTGLVPFTKRIVDTMYGGRDSAVLGLGRKAGRWLENRARLAHFLGKVDEAKTALGRAPTPQEMENIFENAATSAKVYLFDYGDLTDTEVWLRQNVFPFYTWFRKNVPLQVRGLTQNPKVPVTLEKARQEMHERSAPEADPYGLDEKYVSEFIRDNYPVRVRTREDGTEEYLTIAGWMPFGDLMRMLDPGNVGMEIVSMVNPLVSEAVEQITNRDLFFENEVARGNMDKRNFMGKRLDARWVHALKNIRLLNEIDRTFYRVGHDGLSKRVRALRALTGFRVYPQDPQKQIEYYNYELEKQMLEAEGEVREILREIAGREDADVLPEGSTMGAQRFLVDTTRTEAVPQEYIGELQGLLERIGELQKEQVTAFDDLQEFQRQYPNRGE